MEKSFDVVASGFELSQALMTADISGQSTETASQVYGILNVIGKAVAHRLDSLKDLLREKVSGDPDSKNSTDKTKEFVFDGGSATVTQPETPAPSLDRMKLAEILLAEGLKKGELFDRKVETVWVLNGEKLDQLLAAQKISAEQIAKATVTPPAPTARLTIKLDKAVERALARRLIGMDSIPSPKKK
jgi:hypothetical protein